MLLPNSYVHTQPQSHGIIQNPRLLLTATNSLFTPTKKLVLSLAIKRSVRNLQPQLSIKQVLSAALSTQRVVYNVPERVRETPRAEICVNSKALNQHRVFTAIYSRWCPQTFTNSWVLLLLSFACFQS